ncbi:hypothetical protein C8R46DRAFT_1070789 [Mycena filopes]|nr:hypothetical protein C8R46DRAFT_1070789 [Mycena filopes]
MKMRIVQLLLLLLASAFGQKNLEEEEAELCKVRVWVRAEDLSPERVSRGELRIKTLRPECANQIASVALRLQLDEFGEVKFLREGAVLRPSNASASAGSDNIAFDYQAHDDALTDPQLWAVKAEERRAWTTVATLLDNPDLSHPIVTPFTVAVPAVNYPPVITQYRRQHGAVAQHSFSSLGFRYFAVVKFTDGRTEDVLAGHTAFTPSSEPLPQRIAFTANETFEYTRRCDRVGSLSAEHAHGLESCLPEAQRSVFFAEVTLEDGNVVQPGQKLRGRVTVRATNGSTAMSNIAVLLWSRSHHDWAQAQAAGGGDAQFYNATSGACHSGGNDRVLHAESEEFDSLLGERDGHASLPPHSYAELSLDKPFIPFELEVPRDTPVDFTSYYSRSQTLLHLTLTVRYALDVAKCRFPDQSFAPPEDEGPADDSAKTEEGLWDMYAPIGKPPHNPRLDWLTSTTLEADIPVVVFSSNIRSSDIADSVPHVHYSTPGALAPVLRGGARVNDDHLEPGAFPVAQPVFNVEPPADTFARLMQSGTDLHTLWNGTRWVIDLDPTKDYHIGSYAGMLWRKKVVAEERGIWPLQAEVVERDEQQPLKVGR